MLGRSSIHMLLTRHLQTAASSLIALFQRPLSTFMTVAVLAVALTLPTLFWVIGSHLESLALNWQKRAHIALYLDVGIEVAQMESALKAVQAMEGVETAILKTPAEGLSTFEQQEGMHDMMHYLPNNPLPGVIEVVPVFGGETTAQLTQLVARLKQVAFVDQVQLEIEWIKRLYAILAFVKILIQGVMGMLAIGVVLIIGNTLRLSLHHRQSEIQVLKLIGATDSYIIRPFLYTGIWYGVLGAVGAMVFVSLFLFYLEGALVTLMSFYQLSIPWIGLTLRQAYCLVGFSALLGFVSAQCFVRGRLDCIQAER